MRYLQPTWNVLSLRMSLVSFKFRLCTQTSQTVLVHTAWLLRLAHR